MTARAGMTSQAKETLVGALVLLVVGGLLAWASLGGRADPGDGYSLTARFDQVDGIAVGSPVYLAGMQVGEVSALRLEPRSLKPELTLTIRHRIGIPVDSAVMVMSDGVLGPKFLKIDPGSEDDSMKPGGRFEYVQSSVILELVLERVVNGAEERLRGAGAPGGKK